ncbi:MAG: Asp23/Gls24 family envelope stress response protein [Candidatus Subteraquimicrobiales bacterium]|nr:Asp23/Gls24 family envelope stress response protein [Candidatus Subteraquimicrobiales bacterium]
MDTLKDILAATEKLIKKGEVCLKPKEKEYCLGKKAGTNLLDKKGKVIVEKGETITEEHIDRAEKEEKLHELALGAGFGVVEESWKTLLKETKGESETKSSMNSKEEISGKVQFSDSVFINIVAEATLKIPGVVSLYSGKPPKAIKVSQANGKVSFDIHLTLSYGVNFSEVARLVKEKVKKDIEMITSYKVEEINILIDSVQP